MMRDRRADATGTGSGRSLHSRRLSAQGKFGPAMTDRQQACAGPMCVAEDLGRVSERAPVGYCRSLVDHRMPGWTG